jgi:cell wall-associated NlpC family hydrolase
VRILSVRILHRLAGVLLVLGMIVTSGCAGSHSATPSGPTQTAGAPSSETASSYDADRVERDLRTQADSWDGVPHEWGGTSRRGVDCSGLTSRLYADALGLQLPRTTKRQARVGERVSGDDLQPGDLVFFRPERKKRHVGVYLSDGEFVHASSSSGVTISSLNEPYWQRTWWQARRLLPGMTDAPSSPASPSSNTRPAPDDDDRAGW